MSLARLVVTAVRIEGRTKAEVSRDYGVSPRWVYELCRRFDSEGEAGLEPRSRRPRASPQHIAGAFEDEIVELRKALADEGLDAGAHTIAVSPDRRHGEPLPSVATIWRILARRGFVTPQPQKRPRSSFVRFEADDAERALAGRHHPLASGRRHGGRDLERDRRSLPVPGGLRSPGRSTKAADVVASFHRAAAAHGFPASLLTDNGAVFTAAPRGWPMRDRAGDRTRWGSATGTRAPITPRPAARSSASTRPSSDGSPSRRRRRRVRELQAKLDRFASLLQRGAAAPGDRPAYPRRGVRSSAEGDATAAGVRGPDPLPGPTGQGRHHRHDHASPQLAAAPHRAGASAHRHPGARARGRPATSGC